MKTMNKNSENNKSNKPFEFVYFISTIPDINYPEYIETAGGNVTVAVGNGCEQLMRAIANNNAGSCIAELIFAYDPTSCQHPQDRLKSYLRLKASNKATLKNLDRVLLGGPLGNFCEFELVKDIPTVKGLKVNCQITRKINYHKPTHSCEFNPKIPESYITIAPFIANLSNDYLMTDQVLDRINEPVLISIEISPADISAQIQANTDYLSELNSINRREDFDDAFNGIDFTGDNDSKYFSRKNHLEPLNHQDPQVNEILQNQRKFGKTLTEPHLSFHIKVTAKTEPAVKLVSSVLADSAFQDGSYQITTDDKETHRTSSSNDYKVLEQLNELAPVQELTGLFRPLIASSSPLCCYKNTDPPHVDEQNSIIIGTDARSQHSKSNPILRGILIFLLCKHLFFSGMPGSGKTTCLINFLLQLIVKGITFTVLACQKKEFRILKTLKQHPDPNVRRLAEILEYYTPGIESLSPFRFNPFEIPSSVDPAQHAEVLMSVLKSSIPISVGSLPSIIKEALELIYKKYPDPNKPPTMRELKSLIKKIMAAKAYSSDTRSDMQTALDNRFNELLTGVIGRIFECRFGISIKHLLKTSSVIELDVLPDEATCLDVLFILTGICEYVQANPSTKKGVRHVIIIEESHVIFGSGNNTPNSEEIANVKAAVVEIITKMLVTFRALGICIIFCDQHPTSLNVAAIKSVGTQCAFRQVYSADREELARSMLLDCNQALDIALLKPGWAYLMTEGFFEPLKILTPNLAETMNVSLSDHVTDKELLQEISHEKWFINAKNMRIRDGLDQLKDAMDQYDNFMSVMNSQVTHLLKKYNSLRNNNDKSSR